MTLIMHRAKWLVPLVVIIAMLATVGVAWGQSGGDGGIVPELTDENPQYENVVVGPADSTGAINLYSIDVSPETSVVPLYGGDICTVVLTNLLEGPVADLSIVGSTVVGGVTKNIVATAKGDLTGDVVVVADVWNSYDYSSCIVRYGPLSPIPAALPLPANISGEPVIVYPNITVHPGQAVTLQVPIGTGTTAIKGAIFNLKAFLVMPGTGEGDEALFPIGGPITWDTWAPDSPLPGLTGFYVAP